MSFFHLWILWKLWKGCLLPQNQQFAFPQIPQIPQTVLREVQFFKIALRLRVSECRVMLASAFPSGSKLDEISSRLRVSECRVMLASAFPSGSKLDTKLCQFVLKNAPIRCPKFGRPQKSSYLRSVKADTSHDAKCRTLQGAT